MKGGEGSWTSVFSSQIFHSLLIRLCFALFQCPQLSSKMGAGLPQSGSRGLQRPVTFHVVIAGDSFCSEQIVFCGLMGLSCSNLGSDEFCFHVESRICSNRAAGFFGCYCFFVCVLIAKGACMCSLSPFLKAGSQLTKEPPYVCATSDIWEGELNPRAWERFRQSHSNQALWDWFPIFSRAFVLGLIYFPHEWG